MDCLGKVVCRSECRANPRQVMLNSLVATAMNSPEENTAARPEPWLRGTLSEVPAVLRAALHALELAGEDAERWCSELTPEQINARPFGLASVAFHMRHIAGSLDRLLTYAEGKMLAETQLSALREEAVPSDVISLRRDYRAALQAAARRIRAFSGCDLEKARSVGRQRLPTTVGGLLVHIADHTQRHSGQMVTTAKVVRATSPAALPEDAP